MVTISNIILLAVCACVGVQCWKVDRKPKYYGDKIHKRHLITSNRRVQKKIVFFHNFYRTRVVPPASDMLSMSWHKGAARAAQRWAGKCSLLIHDNETGRWIDEFGSCGQNIFVASHQVPWFFAVETWFLEKDNFTYGSTKNQLKVIGHYTQMVWSSTHKVGCGFSKCLQNSTTGKQKIYYNYVCNYCPIGNRSGRLGRPYKRGAPCSSCNGHCRAKKLCTNSCPYADFWANCAELHATWPAWLCHTNTDQGKERRKFCRATCLCKDKIY